MERTNILICGGRDFNDHGLFDRTMIDIHNQYVTASKPAFYIAGGARGADTEAIRLAKIWGIPYKIYPADWEQYGKRAGYIRNQQMLDEGKPDLVVAFPGGKGTAMMVDIARKAGVKVIEVEWT